jgi:aryl-alcohol dehydrogenase-like predicted oxidoreductase
MKYRNFGKTDLKASVVGFGVWTVSTSMWGVNDHELRLSLLRRAKELGITFYDTADVYGDGTGETILRDAFGDSIKDITIATKFGYDWYNHPGLQAGQRERPHDWSPAYLTKACDESLQIISISTSCITQGWMPSRMTNFGTRSINSKPAAKSDMLVLR